MKTKPIIFQSEMVRALLEGRKTQTRRVMKPQPWCNRVGQWMWERRPGINVAFHPNLPREHYGKADIPYGLPYQVGDLLWVRETWAQPAYRPSTAGRDADLVLFGADYPDLDTVKWRPSIHMPRWASRLTLEVTDVRVQRLQDISVEDVTAEGINLENEHADEFAEAERLHMAGAPGHHSVSLPEQAPFALLWDSINAERGFGWDENPWVVAVTFKVHSCNVDRLNQSTQTDSRTGDR
jgi:hypothetical protein